MGLAIALQLAFMTLGPMAWFALERLDRVLFLRRGRTEASGRDVECLGFDVVGSVTGSTLEANR